jgi:predicted Zn-dependent protease
MKPRAKRGLRWLVGSALVVALLVGGYVGARHYVWPSVKTWRIARMNREARAFLDQGDLGNALLVARKSLQASIDNPDAWRVAAKASEARHLADAVAYQDNLTRAQPTTENRLELIRLALLFDVPSFALDAVKQVGESARDNPAYHRMAAQVYARVGQPVAARFQLLMLTQLQPDDRTAQLDLAEMDLAANLTPKDPTLRARVLALSDDPALRIRALTLLLRENVTGKIILGTDELLRRLENTPDLGVKERLLLIQGNTLLGRPIAGSMLAQLQAEVADRPADVVLVLEYLNQSGHPENIEPWYAKLPPATRQNEDVQFRVAEALLALHQSAALETFLRGGHWPKREFMRSALLAHAYRDQGRSADFVEAWRLALIGAGSDLRKTTLLLARADEWRWVNERHDVVWKLFGLVPANESVQQVLILWERRQGNTANLHRLFSRIVEVQPDNNDARNNFAYTSLLLDANVARAGLIAADLVAKHPENPYYATTYALALYKQGRVPDALARLDALTATQKLEPVRMLVRVLCLTAQGNAPAASDLINDVALAGMLPEERRLADGATLAIAQLDRLQGNRSRLLTFHRGRDQTSAAAGWLALVSPDTRTTASTDMQLADSLYAAPDWPGLRDLLRATNWKNDEYLRSALLAHVYRQAGELLESREEWRQALAVADRNPARLQNLRALATQWQWAPERIEALNLLFERTPGDRTLLVELLRNYREARRTPDLYRVLSLYVGDNPDATDEAVAQAYYGLLLETNVARAQVVARNAFEAKPADSVRRMVYAFSLLKQRRAAEAVTLLKEVNVRERSDLLPIPLLRAAIEVQMGMRDEARASLALFQGALALPEESTLAAKISSQLVEQSDGVKLPRT